MKYFWWCRATEEPCKPEAGICLNIGPYECGEGQLRPVTNSTRFTAADVDPDYS